MRYTCDHSPDRTSMCITCMNYESNIESLRLRLERMREALEYYADEDNSEITGFCTASGSRYVRPEYHQVAKKALEGDLDE